MKESEGKSGLKMTRSSSANDMSQCISLFKKYLLTRPQSNNVNVGRTNTLEFESSHISGTCPSDIHASSSSSPWPPPSPHCNPTLNRPPSLLEQGLLPQMRCNGELPSQGRFSTAQLTIFYDGDINVYDNVPIDKAQIIMLLAGESSSSNTTESPEMNIDHHPNASPRSKLKTGLPLARRHSLQCFLQKRRQRKLVKKSPYGSKNPNSRNNGELGLAKNIEEERRNEYDQNHVVSLSPFPSHLGFSIPISANKAY